jgi:glycosyltransferase involved in cell wall biosynthesis
MPGMTSAPRKLDVVLAAEALIPNLGGAERFAIELLEALRARHRVRALVLGAPEWVAAWRRHSPALEVRDVTPPPVNGSAAWARRRLHGERMRSAVAAELARDPADVVIGQLYTGAGAVQAARGARASGVLLLAGYEALCHWAFYPDSRCRPESRCRSCPRPRGLPWSERQELLRVRSEQDAALAAAAGLVAPSETMASACHRITGRRPRVAAPVTAPPPAADAAPDGPLLAVSAVWRSAKGSDLLAPLARRLPHRRLVVQAPNGLPPGAHRDLASMEHVSVRRTPSEIAPLLAGAGVVLVPSQVPEPFGRVAFEAMAAGVPVLASGVGGLTEFVPGAQLVRPPDNPDAWAAAVRRLEDPAAWMAARRDGLAAAQAVLATDPVGRIEGLLHELA